MARVEIPALAALILALAASGCGKPTCPPLTVRPPAATERVPWLDGSRSATVEVEVSGKVLNAILDTGFPRSAISAASAGGIDVDHARLRLGSASADRVPLGLLLSSAASASVVIGGDVLYQLPLVLDARARTTELRPDFGVPPPISTPLDVWVTGRCEDDNAEAGPEGPHAFLVDATLDGQALRFILDTGAEATFVRTNVVEVLDARPQLVGVRVATAFAGAFAATATRARTLSVGDNASAGSLLITAPEVDAYLNSLQARYGQQPVAGFLGWSFLREFLVLLDGGYGPDSSRTLTLSRFATQDHWKRELIGIGTYTSPVADPPGSLRIDDFLSVSPARDAGLLVGDIIVTVDGVPAASAPSPFAPPGTEVLLEASRSGMRRQYRVQVQDLLPDPPP